MAELERRQLDRRTAPRVAYFSMEIGLDEAIPTYSGGLGILAGDTLRAAADHGLPLVGITLAHRCGYFRQSIDAEGNQVESSTPWDPAAVLEAVDARVSLQLADRVLEVQAWRYWVEGLGGRVPVYLLDTDVEGNHAEDRKITDQLYGGDGRLRLLQEVVLGIGGVALLRALGQHGIGTYHMNEGHSALLGLALLEEVGAIRGLDVPDEAAEESVRWQCMFTTHTPVPAGHDRFSRALLLEVLGSRRLRILEALDCFEEDMLNMTHLALSLSRYVNGVAMRHREVSTAMFPNYSVQSITNGVHAATWASPSFQRLFDRNIPEWRSENFNLRYAVALAHADIAAAHAESKRALFAEIERRTGATLDPAVFTLIAARRATAYKRADLLFTDAERVRTLARASGGLQILYAGKAHPRDQGGKDIIRRIHAAAGKLREDVHVLYLEDYDMRLAKLLVAGGDLWLNTPHKPQEASGTSGMKAALNGVPSLSVLDGWWIEGHVENVTGWSIGENWVDESDTAREAATLYDKLEQQILPLYYERPDEYLRVRKLAIALNGSFFTAERMVIQYAKGPYHLNGRTWTEE